MSISQLSSKCDKAYTLTVDLFFDGRPYKSGVTLPLMYDQTRPGSEAGTDLIDTARRYVSPEVAKMMGRVYITSKKPANPSSIPWNLQGTYISGDRPYLVYCSRILEYQKKYIAINLSPAPQDETLKMDVYWRGKLIRKDYELPIHFTHGERVFGESRVDLAEAVREAIPPELLDSYDTTLQFRNRRAKPDEIEVMDWSERKPGVARLMAKWNQIKKLQGDWVAVNVEPVMKISGLKCDSCCVFDAAFQHEESNQFYCSKQCFLDHQ